MPSNSHITSTTTNKEIYTLHPRTNTITIQSAHVYTHTQQLCKKSYSLWMNHTKQVERALHKGLRIQTKAHRTLSVKASVSEWRISGNTRFCCSTQCAGSVPLGSSFSSLPPGIRNTCHVEQSWSYF